MVANAGKTWRWIRVRGCDTLLLSSEFRQPLLLLAFAITGSGIGILAQGRPASPLQKGLTSYCMITTVSPIRKRVGIVGPCAAGKSTLIKSLSGQDFGVELRHIAQEHSYVQSMWQQISKPKWLIFLDVSYPVSMQRKKLDWQLADYEEQQRRLAHARQHANLYLMTDGLTPEQVTEKVLEFLNQIQNQ
jgi:hypothetical protein